MIFLTVGTQLPFERLVKIVDEQVEKLEIPCVFGQISESSYLPKNFEYANYLSPSQFKSKFDGADIIISHAGMGTILESLSNGKKVIVMPRDFNFNEHRNDHQIATCAKLHGLNGLNIVNNEKEMELILMSLLKNESNAKSTVSGEASDELMSYIEQEIGNS